MSVYFRCVLDRRSIERKFELPDFVVWYDYDGRVAGHEAGFECKQCKSLLCGGMAKYGGQLWAPAEG